MECNTYDPTNPYFTHDFKKICGICNKKYSKNITFSMNSVITATTPIKAYAVLESVSKFKFNEKGPQNLCLGCFNNVTMAYKFQQMCNKAQQYFEDYLKHQKRLLSSAMKSDDNQDCLILPEEINEKVKLEDSALKVLPTNNELCKNLPPNKKLLQKSKRRTIAACKVCNKQLLDRNMKLHMLIHTGEKPHKCKQCGASFTQPSALKYHTDMHENKRNYMCKFCGKALLTSSQLIVHERRHTGEKPHKCQSCNQAFTTSAALKVHMVVHTGEKAFTCQFCAKSFNRDTTLRTHIKIHTGDKPHVCIICNASFIQAHCLRSHLLNHAKHQFVVSTIDQTATE